MTVLDFSPPPKQIRVKVYFAHWSGEDQVEAKDSQQIVVISYEVNGFHISSSQMEIEMGVFASAHIFIPDGHPEIDDETNEKNHAYHERLADDLRDSLTSSDWLEETTDDDLYLPIARLEWVERDPSEWKKAKGQ